MGKLRIEPKKKSMDPEHYRNLLTILKEAQSATWNARVFWDLDEGEDASKTRKEFLQVAEKESIPLQIRRPRGANSLELRFEQKEKEKGRKGTPTRIPAKESRQRILNALKAAGRPLGRAEIMDEMGLSAATWNLRIKELLAEGKVTKQGQMRNAAYTLT